MQFVTAKITYPFFHYFIWFLFNSVELVYAYKMVFSIQIEEKQTL